MANLEVVNETPLNFQEMKDKLDQIKKRDKDLNPRGIKTYDYISKFTAKKNFKKIKEDLVKLDISRLKDKHINKIIDVLPKDVDELKSILSGENITLKQEDLIKVIEIVKNA